MEKKSRLRALEKIKENGGDYFVIHLTRNSTTFKMDLKYHLPLTKFAEIVAYLERFSVKEL